RRRARTTRSASSAASSVSPCSRRSSPISAGTAPRRPSSTGRRRRSTSAARSSRSRRWSPRSSVRVGQRSRPWRRSQGRPSRSPRPGGRRLMRAARVLATLAITGLCVAYILWKIDVGRTAHVIAHARVVWLVGSVAIMAGSVWPMAWRWQRLLAARGVHESLARLVRTYFVGYAAGQVLPTALGGDASRIYETTRRHAGAGGAAAGTVLLER